MQHMIHVHTAHHTSMLSGTYCNADKLLLSWARHYYAVCIFMQYVSLFFIYRAPSGVYCKGCPRQFYFWIIILRPIWAWPASPFWIYACSITAHEGPRGLPFGSGCVEAYVLEGVEPISKTLLPSICDLGVAGHAFFPIHVRYLSTGWS